MTKLQWRVSQHVIFNGGGDECKYFSTLRAPQLMTHWAPRVFDLLDTPLQYARKFYMLQRFLFWGFFCFVFVFCFCMIHANARPKENPGTKRKNVDSKISKSQNINHAKNVLFKSMMKARHCLHSFTQCSVVTTKHSRWIFHVFNLRTSCASTLPIYGWDHAITSRLHQSCHGNMFVRYSWCVGNLLTAMEAISLKTNKQKKEKVYFRSQILVHEYWTILHHFGIPVLFASGSHQHVLKNVNITISGNSGTPEMFQYSPILGRSSIWDLKYTFSKKKIVWTS